MLEAKLSQFKLLEQQMQDPAVQAQSGLMSRIAREHGQFSRIEIKYQRFKDTLEQIA